ncbi:hypothetical protein ACFQ36_07085 [Arthrobacter sp. GCM10027362]|uniref:hypothetical protein n=1 Tax=Arthrobacter sp. GCM10027362 TaxID=3273379 RepID=UPI0036406A13
METDALMERFIAREQGQKWTYSEHECFLCLTPLTERNRTREHVFPKWLLNRHGLWAESMTLMNGTTMQYRQLTIPCCRECNGQYLSIMEKEVATAFDGGYDEVKQLDRKTLFLWLAKLFYGLLIKERRTLLDRRDQNGNMIVGDDDLDRFAMHHLLMQAVRGGSTWSSARENPWSIFVFKCQTSEDVRLNFDYIDSFRIPFLAIRSGDVAVIAALQDWGHLENGIEVKHLAAAQQLALHPFQFKEAALVACYTLLVFFQDRRFVVAWADGQREIIPIPMPSPRVLEDAQLLHLAPELARHFNTPLEHITDGRKLITTLMEPDGTPWTLAWDGTDRFPTMTIHPVDALGEHPV